MAQKVAIIDIDETMWNLAEVWYPELLKIHPECPKPGTLPTWDFQDGYMTHEECMASVNIIHCKQDQYGIWPHIKEMIDRLKKHNIYVVIASHREENSRIATTRWLLKHGINYDRLYVGSSKTDLFDEYPNICVVVDDSPSTIQKALEKGLQVVSLQYPYNKHLAHQAYICADTYELSFATYKVATGEWR